MKKEIKLPGKHSTKEQNNTEAGSSIPKNIKSPISSDNILSLNTFLLSIAGKVSGFGGWSVDISSQTVFWSDEVCEIHEMPRGHSPKLTEGINFYAPECRDIISKAYLDCEKNGIPYDLELQIITAKGNRIWVRAIGEAVKDKKGKIIQVQGAFKDITLQKQSEMDLFESEDKYRSLVEASLDGIMIDQDDKIAYINPAGVSIFGASSEEELIGKNPFTFFPEENHKHIFKKMELIRTEGKSLPSNEDQIIRLDGKVIDVEVSAAPFMYRGKKAFQVVFKDISKRKSAERELINSEERFRKAFHSHPGIIGISTISDGKYLDVNDNFCKLLEYKRGEVIGHTSKELNIFFNSDERDSLIDIMNKNGNIVNFEVQARTKSGKIKTGLFSAEKIFMEGELCLLGQFNDITEIRKYIDELRVSEERFSRVFHSSPYAITLTELETGKLIDVNESFVRFTGYTKDEMIGKSTVELNMWINQGDRERTMKPLKENGFAHIPEICFRVKSGEIRTWDLSMEVIEINGRKIIIGMIGDITDSKSDRDIIVSKLHLSEYVHNHSLDDLLEETLNEAEKLTGSLIGFYHFVNDDQQHLTLQNWSTRTKSVFCKAEGKGSHYTIDKAGVWVDCVNTRKPVIHNDYMSLRHRKGLPPNHAEVIRELVVPVIRNGKIKAILGVGNKPIYYTQKDVETVSFLADLVWDITERKKIDEELKENESKLKEIVATKDKFFNIIAHDLRSPFNSILGFSDLLEEQMKEKNYADIEEYSKLIHSASKRAVNLLANLLEWARTQTGMIKFSPEYFDLAVQVKEVTDLFSVNANQKSIMFLKDMPANVPVIADKSMISNILRNLISNAIKFSHLNGTIIIKVEVNQKDTVVSVKDNGVGIDAENIRKLFRLDMNFTTLGTQKEKGTGLGLLICKEFAEKHGGKLKVESVAGSGSTFSFNIPIKNQ